MANRPTITAPAKPAKSTVTVPAKPKASPIVTKPLPDLRQKIILPSNRIAKPARIVLPPMGVAPSIARIIIPEQMEEVQTQAESEYYRPPEENIPEEEIPEEIVDDEGIEEIPEEGEENEPLASDEAQEQEMAEISGGEKVGEVPKPNVRPVKTGVFIPDDYGNIRPPTIRDRTEKDFLESGSAGSMVNVQVNTPIVPWVAGIGPGAGGFFLQGGPSQYIQVINIRTEDRKSIPLTLSFDTSFVKTLNPLRYYDFTAMIRWGVEGSSSEAEIDIRDGMELSLCASSLTVSIGMRRWFSLAIFPPVGQDTVNIGAFVSKGAFGKRAAQRTILGYNELGATSVLFPIPSFARDVEVLGGGIILPGLGQTTLEFQRLVLLQCGVFQTDVVNVGANQKCPKIALSNGVSNVRLFPIVPAPAFNYEFAIFDLGI